MPDDATRRFVRTVVNQGGASLRVLDAAPSDLDERTAEMLRVTRELVLDDLRQLWITYRAAADRSFEQAMALEKIKLVLGHSDFLIMTRAGLTTLIGKHIKDDVRAVLLKAEEQRRIVPARPAEKDSFAIVQRDIDPQELHWGTIGTAPTIDELQWIENPR